MNRHHEEIMKILELKMNLINYHEEILRSQMNINNNQVSKLNKVKIQSQVLDQNLLRQNLKWKLHQNLSKLDQIENKTTNRQLKIMSHPLQRKWDLKLHSHSKLSLKIKLPLGLQTQIKKNKKSPLKDRVLLNMVLNLQFKISNQFKTSLKLFQLSVLIDNPEELL